MGCTTAYEECDFHLLAMAAMESIGMKTDGLISVEWARCKNSDLENSIYEKLRQSFCNPYNNWNLLVLFEDDKFHCLIGKRRLDNR